MNNLNVHLNVCEGHTHGLLIIDHSSPCQTHICGAGQFGEHPKSFERPDCHVCWTRERLYQHAVGQGARDVGSQVIPVPQANGKLRDWSVGQAAVPASKNYGCTRSHRPWMKGTQLKCDSGDGWSTYWIAILLYIQQESGKGDFSPD